MDTGGDLQGELQENQVSIPAERRSPKILTPPPLTADFQPPSALKLPNYAPPTPKRHTEAPPAPAPPAATLPAGNPLAEPTEIEAPQPVQPFVNPDGTPTGTEAPDATRQNVPPSIGPNAGTRQQLTDSGTQVDRPRSPWRFPDGTPVPPDQLPDYGLDPETETSTATGTETTTKPWLIPLAAVIPALIRPAVPPGDKIKDPTKPGDFTTTPPPETPSNPIPPPTGCGCNGPILLGQQQQNARLDDLKDQLAGLAAEGISTAAILAELAKISGAIGVTDLPASVPSNIANPSGGTRNVSSLAGLHLWQTEQLDGVIGQFPQKTTVQTPTGPVDFDTPNVSESLSEILGMLMGLSLTASQTLHTASRTLHQAGSATQQAHLAQLFAKANGEFLGYQGRPTGASIPMAYSPGKDPWDGFLGESTQTIRGWENTDNQDLKGILAELLQAAAIIRAVYWRKLDPRGDFKQQVQGNLRDQSKFVDDETARKDAGSDWEQYLEQVEQGFTQRTGGNTPYDRNQTERPRIRDLSTDDGQG